MTFTKEELALIHGRLEVEQANGPDVYSEDDLNLMAQIIEKIDNIVGSPESCMIVLDADNNNRFFCPEAMARAIAAQPGAITTQDNDTGLVVQIEALVRLDLH